MITASRARWLMTETEFAASAWAVFAETSIRRAIFKGHRRASMLIPMHVANKMELFLKKHGYSVSVSMTMTGVLMTARW